MRRGILVLILALPAFVSAQQTPTFRSRTDIVELDVSVLDGKRQPIRGLTKADFAVFEDGLPQETAIFEAIDVPEPAPPPVAWMRDVTPDVDTNEKKVTRLWVLVLDDALIPTDPYAITASLKVARDVVDRFGPDDLAAIVFTTDSRKAQDFTNDRTKLLATLAQFNPGWANWTAPPKGQRFNPDAQFELGSARTLQNIVETVAALPHQRKAIIWISPGISGGFTSPLLDTRSDTGTLDRESVYRLLSTVGDANAALVLFETTHNAKRFNVPIYPIHPCGMTTEQGVDKCSAAASGRWSLTSAAFGSGGWMGGASNDYGPVVAHIFDENKSYYVLGYYSTNTKSGGLERRLEVKVNRPGVSVVRTRSGYLPAKRLDPPKDAAETLARATAVPIAIADLPLRATAAPFAIAGRSNLAAVTIALGIRQPIASDSRAGVPVTTDLRVSAYTTEGHNKGTQRSTATITVRPGAQGDAEYEALSRIDLPPGRFRLRVAAYHDLAARSGTVMVDVIVPDFSKAPASISGVVLSAQPGRPSAPRDLFTPLIPVVPTAQRDFATSDHANAFFYLYQAARLAPLPAQVSTRITDVHDAALIDETTTIAVDRFTVAGSLRSAGIPYSLPLSRLAPGAYLLTFEARIGEVTLRRDVQFTVR